MLHKAPVYIRVLVLGEILTRQSSIHLSCKGLFSHNETTFRACVYNETNIDSCPRTTGYGDGNLAPLDLQTPTAFDNNYYKNLVNRRGLLHSDQQLFNGGSTDSIVWGYSNSQSTFSSDFLAAMIKMGDISPLTGSKGERRNNCRKIK
ncbi:Peroxidase [Actinidia chinensis var. chinensis]|uniref:peroxidase n=1 Tax=Actinidia chinensis var. chinensis TaxID=1590841 RepID=A0A2R6PLQ1_ACTCC|nr:Peroxidase [Actinidia chinensis var. chinensis]